MSDKYYGAWQNLIHAKNFDEWSQLASRKLKRVYENFNEIRLFLDNEPTIKQGSFVEIGCATGELYRYLKNYHPRFNYYGFDVSNVAIARAKQKYPHGKFFICKEDLSDVKKVIGTLPAVLFARDVVLHQIKPFSFLAQLISIPGEAAILRIRTRDKGESVLDPEISCQWYHNNWIPYMILNIDEVIKCIKKTVNFSALYVLKNYQLLGGHYGRFLPKDCYYPETGTAHTVVYIQLSRQRCTRPEIKIAERDDLNLKPGLFKSFLVKTAKNLP